MKKTKLISIKMFREEYCATQIARTACARRRGLTEVIKLLEQNKKRTMKRK